MMMSISCSLSFLFVFLWCFYDKGKKGFNISSCTWYYYTKQETFTIWLLFIFIFYFLTIFRFWYFLLLYASILLIFWFPPSPKMNLLLWLHACSRLSVLPSHSQSFLFLPMEWLGVGPQLSVFSMLWVKVCVFYLTLNTLHKSLLVISIVFCIPIMYT